MAFLRNHESTSKEILLLYQVIGSIFSDFYKQIGGEIPFHSQKMQFSNTSFLL